MRAIITVFVGLILAVAAHAGEGLPLPWPFPWAKECKVNWMDMQGRYLLSESSLEQEIELKIFVITEDGLKRVHVAHYGQDGQLVSHGFDFVSENQKTLRLYLIPANADGNAEPTLAVIKLYYQSSVFSCRQDALVPILTIEGLDPKEPRTTQYRLVRRPGNKN